MIIPNIWENKSHVPNHQPDMFAEFQNSFFQRQGGMFGLLFGLRSGFQGRLLVNLPAEPGTPNILIL